MSTSRRLPGLLAAFALAVSLTAATNPTLAPTTGSPAASDVDAASVGSGISVLRPRGSKGSDQPENSRPGAVGGAAALNSALPQNGIQYHNGPVVMGAKVVAIYWANTTIFTGGPAAGTTGSGVTDGSLVGHFLRNLGGSPYYNINTTYTNSVGTAIPNSLAYTGFWANSHNVQAECTTVADTTIRNEIIWGFNNNKITYDANTIYAVFSAGKVNLNGGFGNCTPGKSFQYCAYHGYFTWGNKVVLYAAMPYNNAYPGSCTAFTAGGPANNDPGADAEVNTLAHEIEEANTDPRLNAWYDANGNENADKCAWTFGTLNPDGKGNITVGGKSFLVQQNWLNVAPGGSCAQTYGATPTTGSISGKVTNSVTAAAISGATVTVVGGSSTSTDGSGNYSFTNVTPSAYNITVSKSGYTTGGANGVTVNAGFTTTANVALTPTAGGISGKVTDSVSLAAVSGATVTIVGGAFTTTDGSGNYSFSGVAPSTYNLTVTKTGYTSGGANGVVVNVGLTTTANVALTPTTGGISGKVTNSVTSAAISGATVTITGGASTTTDGSGNYSFSGVAAPSAVNLTSTLAGFTGGAANSVSVNPGVTTTANMTMTPTSGGISGKVTDSVSLAAISGATVTIVGGASTLTDGSGNYSFSGVAPSTYNLTVTKTGYTSGGANGVVVNVGLTTTANMTITTNATAPGASTLSASTSRKTCVFLECHGGGVALSWTAAAANGSPVTQYRIYRSTTSTVSTSGAAYATSTTTTYADLAATANVIYYYKVVAVNVIGPGPDSNVASARAG